MKRDESYDDKEPIIDTGERNDDQPLPIRIRYTTYDTDEVVCRLGNRRCENCDD